VATCDKPGCRDELRAEWDDLLGKSKKPEDAIKYVKKLPVPDKKGAGIDDPGTWVKESFTLARVAPCWKAATATR
jgi:hypothetical protein